MSEAAVTGKLATVVLAAGSGRRFGGTKQLTPVRGVPMLRRTLEAIAGSGEQQIVVLGAYAARVGAVIPAGWQAVVAADWADGPGASLRAGLDAATGATAALIVLGDLPWLAREAVERVLEAAAADRSREAVRAYDGEAPGHPLLLRGDLLARARAAPDAGMRGVLAGASVFRVPCSGLGVARDVDGPGDLAGESLRSPAAER